MMIKLSPLFAALAWSGLALAADPAATPATPQGWAEKMVDPTQNAAAFKDPAAFAQWTGAMMNPATSLALMQQGLDPNAYARMLAGLMNPAMMQNYLQFMDPAVPMKWMAAGLDPKFYAAMLGQGLNPASYLSWMGLPMNPQLWNMGAQMLNPGLYANLMAAPMNPALLNTMMTPLNPNTYMNWMGAAANPATYGPWGGMIGIPGQSAAPMALPLDPASLLRMMPVPVK